LQIDAICNQFEYDWKAGDRPRIEAYLDRVADSDGEGLLGELLALELELRRANGEHPQPNDYCSRFPNHRSLILAVFAANAGEEQSDSPNAVLQVGSTVSAYPQPTEQSPDLTVLAEKYVIHEQVGRGAMGWVFRATRRNFEMQVAIKVVSPRFSTVRFRHEAECIVKVQSPHVVTVHDFESLDDGTSALVMEWIEGGDLKEAMSAHGGRLPEHVALLWMRQTCEGMVAVAEQEIIHRDLKPSNIMIDGQGQARVTDFGLARDPRSTDLSGTGHVIGTPYYMAPEQADDPRSVDTRSDIYSFGACFYHALTGRPPFEGNSAFAIQFKHKTEPLISPKARNPEISELTSQLLERCLTKSANERFQSFREVLRFIELTPWDSLEDKALAEYITTYQTRREEYLLRARATQAPDVYVFPDGRTLQILVGDIVEQDVEAVVSSDDWLLSKSSGVSNSILMAAGREILDELRCIPVRPGRAVATSAGNLPAKRIFHAVIAGQVQDDQYSLSRNVIIEGMQSCFYHAESFYVRSIAFPLLGTGAVGFSEEVCLDTMFRFLARNLLGGTTATREARIVLYPHGSTRTAVAAERPSVPNYTFWDQFERAHDMVGDFIDYVRLPDDRIAIIVGDVAGHGIPAAVTVRELSNLAKSYLTEAGPEAALAHFNQHLCSLGQDRFSTMLLAVLDPRTHQLTLFNAGHVRPFWRKADGQVEPLGESQVGLPLGIESEQRYEPFMLTISPGESIVMITDGIVGAMSASGAIYGIDRLQQRVSSAQGCRAIVDRIINDVRQFSDGPLHDALCALCFERL
jgi:serine/threonine protein kinase